MTTTHRYVLIVEGDDQLRRQLVDDVDDLLDGGATVVEAATGEEGLKIANRVVDEGGVVILTLIERSLEGMSGAELALSMNDNPRLMPGRRVLVTQATSLSKVDAALNRGAVHGMITRPWSQAALRDQLRAHLATYHVEHDPEAITAYGPLIGARDRARAAERIAQQRGASPTRHDQDAHLLLAPQRDESDTVQRFVNELDTVLGHPPRLRVSAGTVLLEQGTDVGGIYVILDGEVELWRRTDAGERVVHRDATGPIVGLLSLATQRQAFLEVRAVTEVRALPVTLSQLDRAVSASPQVGALLTRTLINSLASRLRDADELQVRIDLLNASLERERDQLAQALTQLEQAQSRLIEQQRLATLGELAAGIAHELNNPVAALIRATEHLAVDVESLVSDDDADRIGRARTADALSSADQRRLRRSLVDQTGDRALAARAVAAGITDPDEIVRAVSAGGDLDHLIAVHQLGNELRNMATAASRITDLVASLRGYLRGGVDTPTVAEVDVIATIDDALRLLGHRTAAVSIERDYHEVPRIAGQPGPLQQLWTNLIANAADAAGTDGHITVRVDSPEATAIRVRIEDDGPGIDPKIADKLFRPHFTTKHGRVSFGSGLGLSICRQITDEHDGTIDINSSEGVTTATVWLPVNATESSSTRQ